MTTRLTTLTVFCLANNKNYPKKMQFGIATKKKTTENLNSYPHLLNEINR